jgi:hypothetical protein
MKPALALVVVLGLIAVLVFLDRVISRRRAKRDTKVKELTDELVQYDALVTKIWDIAYTAQDIDPSARLILIELANKRRELP